MLRPCRKKSEIRGSIRPWPLRETFPSIQSSDSFINEAFARIKAADNLSLCTYFHRRIEISSGRIPLLVKQQRIRPLGLLEVGQVYDCTNDLS